MGFLLSLAVHVAALAGVDVSARVPTVWLLHAGIFVVFIPYVFSNSRREDRKSRDLLAALPRWARRAVIFLFGYMFINFAIFIFRASGGNPAMENGKYLLKSHGRVIREITREEYTALRANIVRGFSGHWMLFYFVPFGYFAFGTQHTGNPRRLNYGNRNIGEVS